MSREKENVIKKGIVNGFGVLYTDLRSLLPRLTDIRLGGDRLPGFGQGQRGENLRFRFDGLLA